MRVWAETARLSGRAAPEGMRAGRASSIGSGIPGGLDALRPGETFADRRTVRAGPLGGQHGGAAGGRYAAKPAVEPLVRAQVARRRPGRSRSVPTSRSLTAAGTMLQARRCGCQVGHGRQGKREPPAPSAPRPNPAAGHVAQRPADGASGPGCGLPGAPLLSTAGRRSGRRGGLRRGWVNAPGPAITQDELPLVRIEKGFA